MRLPASATPLEPYTWPGPKIAARGGEPVRAPHTAGANGSHTADPAVIYFRRRWPEKSACRPGVALSRKGAKSDTRGRKLRSTGTKARTRVGRVRTPTTDLKQ